MLQVSDLHVSYGAITALAGSPSDRDRTFYTGKIATAKWYAQNRLPLIAAERAVAVITQAVFIPHGDEHQIQRPRFRVGPAQVIPAHQPVIDPTKVRRHPPQPLGLQDSFRD